MLHILKGGRERDYQDFWNENVSYLVGSFFLFKYGTSGVSRPIGWICVRWCLAGDFSWEWSSLQVDAPTQWMLHCCGVRPSFSVARLYFLSIFSSNIFCIFMRNIQLKGHQRNSSAHEHWFSKQHRGQFTNQTETKVT